MKMASAAEGHKSTFFMDLGYLPVGCNKEQQASPLSVMFLRPAPSAMEARLQALKFKQKIEQVGKYLCHVLILLPARLRDFRIAYDIFLAYLLSIAHVFLEISACEPR